MDPRITGIGSAEHIKCWQVDAIRYYRRHHKKRPWPADLEILCTWYLSRSRRWCVSSLSMRKSPLKERTDIGLLSTQSVPSRTVCVHTKAMTVRLCGCRIINCGYTSPYLNLSGTLALTRMSKSIVDRRLVSKRRFLRSLARRLCS
jgi:hypothetical protein